MSDFNYKVIEIDQNVSLHVYAGKIEISIKGKDKLAFVRHSTEMLEKIKKARFRIPESPEKMAEYKYPYSNEYRMPLHHLAFDHHFGEGASRACAEKGYIIEHLDNDGFNCDISNLFILKKIKNTYKGWNYDKQVEEFSSIIALRIFHIIENQTFQITIGFNMPFQNNVTKKKISTIKLLYEYNYELVLQDAEQILETVCTAGSLNIDRWKEIYRYKDIEIEYAPEIEFTEVEKSQKPGTIVWRDGAPYLILGISDGSAGLIHSVHYNKDWNIE